MLCTGCGGLGGAGHDKLLPLTGAAAAGVALEKAERPRSLAGLGRGGKSAQVPQEGVSRQAQRLQPCLPKAPSGRCGQGRRLQAHMAREFIGSHLVPTWGAAGQSPAGSPHNPALLASPQGFPHLSHGESQAALVSLWQVFSCLSPLARGHKGDPLCSAPTRPPVGTTSHLGSRRQLDKPEGLREGKEALWGWGWFSTEQRRGRGTSHHNPVPVEKVSRGWGQALASTAWREGDRRWLLLKLESIRL